MALLQQQSEQAIKMIEDYKAVLEGFLQLQSPEARQSPGIESDEGQAEASMRGPILEQ